MTTKRTANMIRTTLFAIAALLGFTSFVTATPIINGVNLTGFDSSQTIDFFVQGSTTHAGSGTLYLSKDGSGNVYFALVQPIGLNNNAYGTTSTMNGSSGAAPFNWATAHKLSDLLGSDMAEFQFYNGLGTKVFDFGFDYLSPSGSTFITCGDLVGGACSGASQNDAALTTGTASWLLQYATSGSYDLLNFPTYGTGSSPNSPTPSQAAGWVNDIIYEGEISAAAFGSSGFGSVEVPLLHDSPADHQSSIKFSSCTTGCVPVTTPEPSSIVLLAAGTLLLGGPGLLIHRRRSANPK